MSTRSAKRPRTPKSRFRLSNDHFHSAKKCAVGVFERAYLADVLERCEGNLTRAALIAGIGRVTLYRIMKRHGIHRPAPTYVIPAAK